MLLNTGMNFTSKNLVTIYKQYPAELNKINFKIMDEIIERTLKYNKRKQNMDINDLVDVIKFVRNKDLMELMLEQRETIINKKVACNYFSKYLKLSYLVSNHPSISWKLSNISSIINKETNPFKFNDYFWKLVAKMETDKN